MNADKIKIDQFQTIKDVLEFFGTDPVTGFTWQQVQKNLFVYGAKSLECMVNANKQKKECTCRWEPSFTSRFFMQFGDLWKFMFAATVLLVLVALARDRPFAEVVSNSVVTLLLLIGDSLVGVWYDVWLDQIVENVRGVNETTATTIRDNKVQEVKYNLLVPGDLLLISAGDVVPADCWISSLESGVLECDESVITGDVQPIRKWSEDTFESERNFGHDHERRKKKKKESIITRGKCRGIVIATGENTYAHRLQSGFLRPDEIGFEAILEKQMKWLWDGAFVAGVLACLLNQDRAYDMFDCCHFVLALVFAATPERLEAILHICLMLHAFAMSKHKVFIKNLYSMCQLVFADVICSDLTALLAVDETTPSKVMTVGSVDSNGVQLHWYKVTSDTSDANGGVIDLQVNECLSFPCKKPSLQWISKTLNHIKIKNEKKDENSDWDWKARAIERALQVLVQKLGLPRTDADADAGCELNEQSNVYGSVNEYWHKHTKREKVTRLSGVRNSVSVYVRDVETNDGWLLVKAPLQDLLQQCAHVFADNQVTTLTDICKREILQAYHELNCEGLHTLGIAFRSLGQTTKGVLNTKNNLTFIGMIGMYTPPRQRLEKALQICKQSNIHVIVTTNENKRVAEDMARRIGLFNCDQDLSGASFVGKHLMEWYQAQQDDVIQYSPLLLFSQLASYHKRYLLLSAHRHGRVAVMTATEMQDIHWLRYTNNNGIGCGAQAVRHHSNVVLTSNAFDHLVDVIMEAKMAFRHIQKLIFFVFYSNIAKVLYVCFCAILGFPLLFTSNQLLMLTLVIEGLFTTAYAFKRKQEKTMTLQNIAVSSTSQHNLIDRWTFLRCALFAAHTALAAVFAFCWWFCWYSNGPHVAFQQLTHFHLCGQSDDTARF
ncbi:hypothetical protein RFI_28285 [Reticulomyxa filosa]|uniref:P-type ATPase A domain-containing protein n=1 Tax=Reticulomyxa filosa TaxID=46433 RepID=X6M5B0_RETFI|nr:hypothetical protein RFI_28285 [Reticulomyxa filosa]|eukprot:ETO09099.1 hypothetical protein RFI_28285 [Reticulomyxa filosa]